MPPLASFFRTTLSIQGKEAVYLIGPRNPSLYASRPRLLTLPTARFAFGCSQVGKATHFYLKKRGAAGEGGEPLAVLSEGFCVLKVEGFFCQGRRTRRYLCFSLEWIFLRKMASVCKDGWEYDWESMTDAEFARFVESLQSSTKGVPPSRFATWEEYEAFKKRHGHYLVLVCKQLSSVFKGVDLITELRARKGYDAEARVDVEADVIPLDLPNYMEEEADNVREGRLKRVHRE